jgi:hypothetical protein
MRYQAVAAVAVEGCHQTQVQQQQQQQRKLKDSTLFTAQHGASTPQVRQPAAALPAQ